VRSESYESRKVKTSYNLKQREYIGIKAKKIESYNISLKVKIFIWMAVHDRIQSVAQLKKKQWSVPEECDTHDKIETTDHILF